MQMLTFKRSYSYLGSTYGIEIPISLNFGARQVRLRAKVDTGASYCVFQREYAEQLDIEVEAGTRLDLNTATGSFTAYGHGLNLVCLEWQFYTTVYFAESRAFNRNVLGQAGWLNQFRVAIVDHDSILHLSQYDE